MADLATSVGGVVSEIEARLARKRVVRVLELGCGFGVALLDLRARYGDRLEVFGINRAPHDGGIDSMLLTLRDRGGRTTDAVERDLPRILYADIGSRLPFDDESFDLVFSQVAWLYFSNKIGVVREVIRLLGIDGVAKIDADELRKDLPPEYARLVEIWDSGRIVPFGEYVLAYGGAIETTAHGGQYLRFGKMLDFGQDLEPVVEIDVSAIQPHWDGVKCVYRRRPPRDPRSARPERSDRDM